MLDVLQYYLVLKSSTIVRLANVPPRRCDAAIQSDGMPLEAPTEGVIVFTAVYTLLSAYSGSPFRSPYTPSFSCCQSTVR